MGNLRVTTTTDMKISLEHASSYGLLRHSSGYQQNGMNANMLGKKPKLVGLSWQSCGYQQNRHEKTFGAATVLIGYFGNLMAAITTDMKINLEHAKFLWIMQQRRQQQQHLIILRSL